MKISGKEVKRSKFVMLILFLACLMAVVIAKVLANGIDMNDLLMGFGVFAMCVVLACMMWPEKAQIFVQKNDKAIYGVFMLLITPILAIVVIGMALSVITNCCSQYSIWQALGAAGGIGAAVILSTEIVPYEMIYSKIKKAIRY